MATQAAKRKVREQLDEFVNRLSKDTAPFKDTSREGQKERLAKTRGNPEEFKQVYVPHYTVVDAVKYKSATFHADLDAMMKYPEQALFIVHGPREHAKSVQCRINVMEGILNGSIQYWVFAAAKSGLAWKHIDFIAADLLFNDRIAQDYEVKITKYDSQKGEFRGIITCKATGKRNHFQLEAFSDDMVAKGMTFINHRPQGCLVDDLESTKDSRNEDNGKKKLDFVVQELYGAITGPLVWLGNMGRKTSALHQGFEHIYQNEEELKKFKKKGSPPGLFAKACAKNGGKLTTKDGLELMRGFIFKAEYPNGSYLWSERYDENWYASKKRTLGYRYHGEYNGDPVAPGKIFNNFPRYTLADLEAMHTFKGSFLFTWLDPAWGRSKNSSHKCWTVVAYDGHYFYVLDAYCRVGTPISEAIDRWYDAFDKWAKYGLRDGGFEETFAQDERFNQDLELAEERHGRYLNVRPLPNPGDKEARIESMMGIFEQERVLWPVNLNEDLQTVKDQLEYFPDSNAWDGPDSLEACINNVRRRFKRGNTEVKVHSTRRYSRSKR